MASLNMTRSLVLLIAGFSLHLLLWMPATAASPQLDDTIFREGEGIYPQTITGTQKAIPTGSVSPGTDIFYEIVLTSTTPLKNPIVVIDELSSYTTYKSETIQPKAIGIPDPDRNRLLWTISEMEADTPITLSFTATVKTPLTHGLAITNIATLSFHPLTLTHVNYVESSPLLTLTVDREERLFQDTPFNYTIGYSNLGSMVATGVLITNTFSDSFQFVDSTPQPDDQQGNQVIWHVSALSPLDSAQLITVTLNSGNAGNYNNTITMSSQQNDVVMLDAPITVMEQPSLAIAKMADILSASVGEEITYYYTITNTSSIPLTITELYDDKLGLLTPTSTILAPSQVTTATETYTVQQADFPGPIVNIVTVKTTIAGLVITKTAQASVDVTAKSGIQLEVEPSNGNATIGDVVTYTYTIFNRGDIQLTDITLHDDMLGTIALPKTILAAQESMTAIGNYTVTERDIPGPLVNVANVEGESNQQIIDDEATATVEIAYRTSLSLTVKAVPDNTTVGKPIQYHYTITNTGDVTITNITLTDSKFGAISLLITTLLPTQIVTAEHVYTLQAEDLGRLTTVATVTGNFQATPIPASVAQAVVVVEASKTYIPLLIREIRPGIALDFQAQPTLATVGDTIEYKYIVYNTGNVTLTNILVQDDRLGVIATIPEIPPYANQTLEELGIIESTDSFEIEQTARVETTYNEERYQDEQTITINVNATRLRIQSRRTNGINRIEIKSEAGEVLLECTDIPDNTTYDCGIFKPVVTYIMTAETERCGTLRGTFNDATNHAVVTREVYCN